MSWGSSSNRLLCGLGQGQEPRRADRLARDRAVSKQTVRSHGTTLRRIGRQAVKPEMRGANPGIAARIALKSGQNVRNLSDIFQLPLSRGAFMPYIGRMKRSLPAPGFVARARKRLGLSQPAFAEKLGLGRHA